MSAALGSQAFGCRLPARYGSSIDLGSSTSRRRKATSCSPFWDTVQSSGWSARVLSPGNCACAYRNQAPDRLTGTLPWTRVACGNSGGLAASAVTAASDAATSRRTGNETVLIEGSGLLSPRPYAECSTSSDGSEHDHGRAP